MFSEIAWRTFNYDLYFIEEEQLARMIEVFLKQQPEFANEARISGRKILIEMEAHHAILVERAAGVYSFAHLTFQEYFTAKYIVDNQLNGSLEKLVEEHLYDPKWEVVFQLVAVMLDNPDELLLLMKRKANRVLSIPEIDSFFLAGKGFLRPVESEYPDVIRRSFVIANAFKSADHLARTLTLTLKLGYSLAHDIDDEAAGIVLYHDIWYSHKFSLDRALGKAYYDDIAIALGLNREKYSITLSIESTEGLKNYISANDLILKCLSAGCKVTTPIREKLLHEMFLPKEDLEQGELN